MIFFTTFALAMEQKKTAPNYIRLPFGQRRKTDPVNWIYKHRVGLLTTIMIHLFIIVLFLTYQIIIHPVPVDDVRIEIPDEELEQLLKPQEEQVQVIEENMEEIGRAKNRVSDVNSELDASIPDRRHSNVQKIYDEADQVSKSVADNAEAYKKALAELEALENAPKEKKKEDKETVKEKKTVHHQGNVTVSYDLAGRWDEYLYIPAYKCENAGIVVVTIAVDSNGNVTHAAVSQTTSPDDNCINDMAVYAARSSKFNVSTTAPDPQKGTIRFQFERQ